MKNFVQDGDILDLAAPYDVSSGGGALVGEIFGVACADVKSGVVGSFALEGVYDLAKTSAQAWTKGDPVYWDTANKVVGNDSTVGPRVGTATADAANPSSTGRVQLLCCSPQFKRPFVTQNVPAPASINTAGPATLTAAQLLGGVIVRDPNGGARSDTLPTAALLVAAVPNAKVGDLVRCKIINGADAAEAITLLVGAGGAFDANQTAASQVIPQNGSKDLLIRLTNVTPAAEAYVAYA